MLCGGKKAEYSEEQARVQGWSIGLREFLALEMYLIAVSSVGGISPACLISFINCFAKN